MDIIQYLPIKLISQQEEVGLEMDTFTLYLHFPLGAGSD